MLADGASGRVWRRIVHWAPDSGRGTATRDVVGYRGQGRDGRSRGAGIAHLALGRPRYTAVATACLLTSTAAAREPATAREGLGARRATNGRNAQNPDLERDGYGWCTDLQNRVSEFVLLRCGWWLMSQKFRNRKQRVAKSKSRMAMVCIRGEMLCFFEFGLRWTHKRAASKQSKACTHVPPR